MGLFNWKVEGFSYKSNKKLNVVLLALLIAFFSWICTTLLIAVLSWGVLILIGCNIPFAATLWVSALVRIMSFLTTGG